MGRAAQSQRVESQAVGKKFLPSPRGNCRTVRMRSAQDVHTDRLLGLMVKRAIASDRRPPSTLVLEIGAGLLLVLGGMAELRVAHPRLGLDADPGRHDQCLSPRRRLEPVAETPRVPRHRAGPSALPADGRAGCLGRPRPLPGQPQLPRAYPCDRPGGVGPHLPGSRAGPQRRTGLRGGPSAEPPPGAGLALAGRGRTRRGQAPAASS